MSNSIPVVKFLFKSDFKVLNDALNISPAYEVEEFSSSTDLATYLSTISAGLVIASLREKNDLIHIATLMKAVKKTAQSTVIKMVVINFTGDKQFEKAIAKLGIQDTIEPAINNKALKFKLDFWMKSLKVQAKNITNLNQQAAKSADSQKASEKKIVETAGLEWLEPLELEDDIWLLKQESDCKKILSKWLIRLTGPGPYVGQWTEVKANLWRFDIKESEREMYVPGKGAWFFFGDMKPDFLWKDNLWMITGSNFDLFYKDGEKVYSRLKSKDKNLFICKNSMFAKTKETVILESFDKDLVFKKEADALADLEGKGKTDAMGGPLSGKNKTSHIDASPLSGDIESGTDDLSTDPLTQKTETSREKTHWKGKNAYEDEKGSSEGPSSEGVREGEELDLDRKNIEHKKYYKGHNPNEEFGADKKEHEKSEKNGEHSSLDMKGKSSTDQIEGHYGRSKEKGEKENKPSVENELAHKRESQEKGRTDGDLSGKSETDKLKSHYGSSKTSQERKAEDPSEMDESKQRENSKKGRAELDYPISLDEKEQLAKDWEREISSIDKDASAKRKNELEGSAYQDSIKKEKKHAVDADDHEMRGKGNTDQISSHYGQRTDEDGKSRKKTAASDLYDDLFGKNKERKASSVDEANEYEERTESGRHTSGVISIESARSEKNKQKAKDESHLDEICADAKVTSVMIQNETLIDCKLDDFFDDTIIFLTSKKGMANGEIKLELLFSYLGKNTKLNLNGDVVMIDGDGEGNDYITVQIDKKNSEEFEIFMNLYQSRQRSIDMFLEKVRGF